MAQGGGGGDEGRVALRDRRLRGDAGSSACGLDAAGGGEVRPEIGPVDRFQHRTGGGEPRERGEADHIRDEGDHAAHVRYCHMNPLKHGYVERPEEWPYSSVHRAIVTGRW